MQFLQISNISRKHPGRDKEEKIPCLLVRSGRKTIAVQVKADGQIVLRIPENCRTETAMAFAHQNIEWIVVTRERILQQAARKPVYTEQEIEEFKKKLRLVLEERLAFFAKQMGVSYGRVSVRNQKTRGGSCRVTGNLNFNWRLCLVPESILDYVVVHELAHRKEMNHSAQFWQIVESVLPDYRKRREWLKLHGGGLG